MSARVGFTGVLRPSSAAEWGVGGCPAAPRMQEQFPEPEGVEAREGTAAHHFATEGVLGRVVKLGDPAPNGIATDKDMIKGGQIYINAVLSRAQLASSTAMMRVETKVFGHASVHPQNEGTPDTFIIDSARKTVDIFDYKYGFSFVTEFRNPQLMNYAVMVLETSGYTREETADWKVRFHVVQPRYYSRDPVRMWEATGAEVWDFADGLKIAAAKATAPNAPAIAGDHCQHCSARIHCEAARRMTGAMMSFASQGVPQGMDDNAKAVQLLNIRRAIKRLEAQAKGLDAELFAKVESGARIIGVKRGHAKTQEKWKDATDAIAMGDLLGVDLRDEVKPISTFQARAKFRENRIDEAVIAAYATRPTGKAKLVEDDENPADQVFGSTAPTNPNS